MASVGIEEGFGVRAGFSELALDLLTSAAHRDGVDSFSWRGRWTWLMLNLEVPQLISGFPAAQTPSGSTSMEPGVTAVPSSGKPAEATGRWKPNPGTGGQCWTATQGSCGCSHPHVSQSRDQGTEALGSSEGMAHA